MFDNNDRSVFSFSTLSLSLSPTPTNTPTSNSANVIKSINTMAYMNRNQNELQQNTETQATIPLVGGHQNKIQPPNSKKYYAELEILTAQIKEKEGEKEKLKKNYLPSVTNELKALRAEKNATIEKRGRIDADLDKLNKDVPEKMRQLSQLESSLIYKSEDKINTAIQKLEWNLQSQHFKLLEERKIVTEIDRLKRSKRTLAQYLTLKQEISGIRDKQRRMREERDTYFKAVSSIKGMEEKLKLNSSGAKYSAATLKKEIDDLYELKRQLTGNFRRQKEEYQGSRDKMRRESWRTRDENRRSFAADKKKEEDDLEAEKMPFESELKLCNTLINYLTRFTSLFVQEPSTDSMSPSSSLDEPEPAEEIEDGQFVLLKKAGDNEGMDYSSCGRKMSKKNKRPRKQSSIKKITHTPQVIEQFMELDMNAPSNLSDVTEVMEKLKQKRIFYEKEQQPNEVASDAGISATESSLCEMSRQASRTESCEGGVETSPGDQVYADIMKAGTRDNPEILGAHGGCEAESESSDMMSPNSDSTVEGDSGSCESHSSLFENPDMVNHDSKDLANPNLMTLDADRTNNNHNKVSGSSANQKSQGFTSQGDRLDNKKQHQRHSPPKTLSYAPMTNTLENKLKPSSLDCRPKRGNHIPQPWGHSSEFASLLISPSCLPSHSVSLASPLDAPIVRTFKPKKPLERLSSSPAAANEVILPSDNRDQQGSSTKKHLKSPNVSPSSSLKLRSHQTLGARLSCPSPVSSAQWPTRHLLKSPTADQKSPFLDNEDFPPLSQTTLHKSRGSNWSLKSSNGSSTSQFHTCSHSPCDQPAISNLENQTSVLDISNQLNPLHVSSQQLVLLSSPESTYQTLSNDFQVSVSRIPLADKLSTEKWVESSVAFSKDLSPVPCDGNVIHALTESTSL